MPLKCSDWAWPQMDLYSLTIYAKKTQTKIQNNNNKKNNHFFFQISPNDQWYHPSPESVYYFSRTFSLAYLYFQLTLSSPGARQQFFLFLFLAWWLAQNRYSIMVNQVLLKPKVRRHIIFLDYCTAFWARSWVLCVRYPFGTVARVLWPAPSHT